MSQFNEEERKIANAVSLLEAAVGYMLDDGFSAEEIKIFAGCAIYSKLQQMGHDEELKRMTSGSADAAYNGISKKTDEYLRKNLDGYEKIREQTISERW